MQLAVNYSYPLLELAQDGQVQVDLYKCPAWLDLVNEIAEHGNVHIHFPLMTERDMDMPFNGETKTPADLHAIEALLKHSDSNLVNIHFAPLTAFYPEIAWDSTEQAHIDMVVEQALRAIKALTDRFGDRVIVENVPDAGQIQLKLCTLPEVITQVIEESGAGFLFDIAHAQLAAIDLNMDTKAYIAGLPTHRTQELHITGVQTVTQTLLDRFNAAGLEHTLFHRFLDKKLDHLPITDADWQLLDWAFTQIHDGHWATPEVVSLEYGGVGDYWGVLAEKNILAEQVPRLYRLIQGQAQPN